MNFMRVWPTRYCPDCNGVAIRYNNPVELEPRLGLLLGGGELPIWIGLSVGFLVGSAAGMAAGVTVGLAVGMGLFALMILAIVRLQRKHLICECEACGKQYPFAQLLKRRNNARRHR